MTLSQHRMGGHTGQMTQTGGTERDEHALDTAREYGTIAFFVATLGIGVFTVFGDSLQSLLHSLNF